MKKSALVLLFLSGAVGLVPARGQTKNYPPLSEYMMAREDEIALARSAAPDSISAHATVEVLTSSGYKVTAQGDNGFVCMVMRGWAGAPTFGPAPVREMVVYSSKVRAPICFDPVASRTVLPYHELRAKLGIAGKIPTGLRAKWRRHTLQASCRSAKASHSPTCGPQTWILGLESAPGTLI